MVGVNMFNTAKSFVENLLEECNKNTRQNFIAYLNLPPVSERTLLEYYVENLGIKQIAYTHKVDERTVKRWKKEALEIATDHFKQFTLCHFNNTSQSLD